MKQVRESRGLSQAALAELAGLALNTVSKLEQGFTTSPSHQTVVSLAKALGVDVVEFEGAEDVPPPRPRGRPLQPGPWPKIPVLGKISAGGLKELGDPDIEYLPVPHELYAPGRYALIVDGDSMIGDGITEGMHVVIDPNVERLHNDIVVVLVDGRTTVKRIHERENDEGYLEIILLPSNPNTKVIRLREGANVQVLGVVCSWLGIAKRFRGKLGQ